MEGIPSDLPAVLRHLDLPVQSQTPRPVTFVEGPALALMNILDALRPLLQVIPVPGLQEAIGTLSEVIKSFHAISEADEGWKHLALRLERLYFLLQRVHNVPEMRNDLRVLLKPISETLIGLSNDLKRVQNSQRSVIRKFFTGKAENGSIFAYEKMLDQLNTSLTHELCLNTNVTVREIRAELNQITEKSEAKFARSGSFEMSSNASENVHGSAFSNIRILRETSRVQITHNSAVRIVGDAFCHIESH